MMRMLSTRSFATRISSRPIPAKAGAAFAGALLAGLALSGPASAQSSGADPWYGIKVLVTPPDEAAAQDGSAYDSAVAAAEAPVEPPAPATPPEVVDLVPDEDSFEPSLWSSLDLGLGRPVEPEVKEAPPAWLVPGPAPTVKQGKLPSKVEVKEGYTSLSVTSNASANAPVSGVLERSVGGGSGEIKGRVGVGQDNLTVYGTGTLGASASGTDSSLYDNIAVGSTYSVPVGRGSEKLGASVEVNDSQTVTTGVELRAPTGAYERFISVQRQVSPDSDPSGVVKAGVLGKF